MAVAEDGVSPNQDEVYTDPEEDAAREDHEDPQDHQNVILKREVQDMADHHDVSPKDEVSVDEVREVLEDMEVFAREDDDASHEDAGEFAGVGASKLIGAENVCFYQSIQQLYPYHYFSRSRNDPTHKVSTASISVDEAHGVLDAVTVDDTALFHAAAGVGMDHVKVSA